MEDKRRKVSSVMEPYIKFVLKRDHIPAHSWKEGDHYIFAMNISSRRFTEVLEDALCEKQREKYLSNTPVYSYRTLKNPEKLRRLMELNNRRGYHILKCDEKKYYASYGY